jgi:hypothetical protein
MAKGAGNSTVTQYTSNLPEYAKPYYTDLMNRSAGESNRPYQTYQGERIAGFDPATNQGLAGATQFGKSGYGTLNNAQQIEKGVASRAGKLAGYRSGFQPGQFGAAEADQYMSPYMQDVTDRAKMAAFRDYQQQQVFNDAGAAQAGAFGGSRATVQKMMAQNDMMNRGADIEVQGRQSAFENAQQQYERDRQAREQGETFRQGAAGIDLNALGLQNTAAGQLADFQKQHDSMALQRIQALLGVGQTKQDLHQQKLDLAYNDFVNQRDAQRQNLQFYSSLLQGVPISANQNVTQTQPSNPIAGGVGTLTGLQALYALSRQPMS